MRKRVIIADEIQLDGEILKVESKTARVLGSLVGRALAEPTGAVVGWFVGASGERSEIELVPRRDVVEITKNQSGRYQVVVGDARGPAPQKRVPGSAKGLLTVPDDFDAPIEDFRDYR